MDMQNYYEAELSEHRQVLEDTQDAISHPFKRLVEISCKALDRVASCCSSVTAEARRTLNILRPN